MDHGLGFNDDVRADPGRRRVDDGHASRHLLLDDAPAKLGGGLRQLGPRVDAETHFGHRGTIDGAAAPGLDEVPAMASVR
jgi:hypothetical protein